MIKDDIPTDDNQVNGNKRLRRIKKRREINKHEEEW